MNWASYLKIVRAAVLVFILCLPIRAWADASPLAQAVLVAAAYQKELAEHFLDRALKIPSNRQNIVQKSGIIDPAVSSGVYETPIITTPSTAITPEGEGATVINYNPIYDVAWVFHLKKDKPGEQQAMNGERYSVDGVLLLTGDFLRSEPTAKLPKWVRDRSIYEISEESPAVRAKPWHFDELLASGSNVLADQRAAADERIVGLMEEMIRGARDGYKNVPNLVLADDLLVCFGKQDIASLEACVSSAPELSKRKLTLTMPKTIEKEAYATLWKTARLAASLTTGGGQGLLFLTASQPLGNNYVAIVKSDNGRPNMLTVLPFNELSP
jgi:hypothetical protein